MALKAPVRYVSRKIGEAIRSFAASEGLSEDEFAMAGMYDEPTERFYLSVGSTRPIDRVRWHSAIRHAIEEIFPDTTRLVLVVENVTDLDQVYREMVTDDDMVDVTDTL